MTTTPRILIIDDLFGRDTGNFPNRERESLCGKFLLKEANQAGKSPATRLSVDAPLAEVVFCRGQTPTSSVPGDIVENNLGAALNAVRRGWSKSDQPHRGRKPWIPRTPWSMVLIDLCFYTGMVTEESHTSTWGMPAGRAGDDDPRFYFGLTLLDAIHSEFPELPILILSSKPREEVSLEFSRRGALGFIDRSAPDGSELLQDALWNHGLLPDPDGEVVGHSLPLLLALREARRAAGHRENVLIRGERGSGKELAARFINRVMKDRDGRISSAQPRSKKASLITVNSAVLTPNLFASELFGIEPRTATGVDGKIGMIEMAQGGDIFLDEIADMPPEVQAAMLRVLQERQITRVGGRSAKEIDVRFLSATNADLDDTESHFRPDLLDRLRNGGTVWLPPLRERPEDIPLLVAKFVREAESQRSAVRQRTVTPEALELLSKHAWPGNIRELRSVVFDAVSRHLDVEHLVPGHLRLGKSAGHKQSRVIEAKAIEAQNSASNIARLLSLLRTQSFDSLQVGEWAGRLPEVQSDHARMVARLLQAAIEATKRRTPENPQGVIQIHPAAKLAMGDTTLTASKAADLFKRLLGPIAADLDGDLRTAYETSIRLRPKSVSTKKPKPAV